jgi:ribonuclease HII
MSRKSLEFLLEDDELLVHERRLWASYKIIAGIDEAGRGPLAGPVVAAAVAVIDRKVKIPKVFDSKQLSAGQRKRLRDEILSCDGMLSAIAEVSAEEIDKINILRATHLAMRSALAKIANVEFVLVDGLPVRGLSCPSEAIVKGDAKSALIAAASILAKVHRDEIMENMAITFPEYGFEKHKGYGTAAHIEAIKRYGPCVEHRKSFEPIKSMLRQLIS